MSGAAVWVRAVPMRLMVWRVSVLALALVLWELVGSASCWAVAYVSALLRLSYYKFRVGRGTRSSGYCSLREAQTPGCARPRASTWQGTPCMVGMFCPREGTRGVV